MLDLVALPARYLAQYGEEKTAEICAVTPATLRSWVAKEKWPLDAVNRLLQFDPSPIHEIQPLYPAIPEGRRLAILLPSNRATDPRVFEAVMRMYDSAKMTLRSFTFNNLNVVRNMAAAWFMSSGCEWSHWNDDDVIPPFGDAARFKEICELPNFPTAFAGQHTIGRLLSHGKPMIGVAYTGRKRGVPPQMSGANTAAGKAEYARGPQNRILSRDWIGFGSTLVNRSVFEAIEKACPEIEVPENHQLRSWYRWGYFDATPGIPGDDINFCMRAKKAGVEIYADLALMASHIGTKAWNYEDLR